MYWVYILKSLKDSKRYIGYTNDLMRRINEHNSGLVKSTKNRKPLILIHTEEYSTKEAAAERERFYKTGKGRELLKQMDL